MLLASTLREFQEGGNCEGRADLEKLEKEDAYLFVLVEPWELRLKVFEHTLSLHLE